MIDAASPFILLDDGRAEGAAPARLYRLPAGIIQARNPDGVRPALQQLREARGQGLHAAGFLSYEAGHTLEPKLAPLSKAVTADQPPLLWFGLFESYEEVADVTALLPNPAGAWTPAPDPLIQQQAYEAALARVKNHIEAGDIYQANLTFAAEVKLSGSPLAAYVGIRNRAQAGYGALLFTGEHWLLSFSPELFFTLEKGRITTRPMKGTAKRTGNDEAVIEELRSDPKQRAENLMIVDLLRNDLSRVSKPGTVKVPSLYEVETYPTVHQMTSTVTAELEEGLGAIDVIEAIFPCGSITGAPKIRAMQIIDEIEQGPRGVYTGSIGRLAPDGDAAFNVAIRTLTMRAEDMSCARMGLGSGIVADSGAGDEWRECLAKGVFVEGGESRFDLIETMRFDPHDGLWELERHLARMKASAEILGFQFDRHSARNNLQAATFRLREARKVRLLLSASGAVSIEVRPIPAFVRDVVNVAIATLPVEACDFRLVHKTTDRSFYDEALRASGKDEVLFQDKSGYLTEGSFSNIFVERDGRLLTPPLSRGLLPGVLRSYLIDEGEAEEADLTPSDLAGGFYVGNAVRGLSRAMLVQ